MRPCGGVLPSAGPRPSRFALVFGHAFVHCAPWQQGGDPVLSLADYLAARHVMFGSPFAPLSTIENLINSTLEQIGIARHVGIEVPSILLPAYIVAESDLMATLPTRLARRFATLLPVDVFELPFNAPALEFSMVWHERTHRVGAHHWIRSVIREAALT